MLSLRQARESCGAVNTLFVKYAPGLARTANYWCSLIHLMGEREKSLRISAVVSQVNWRRPVAFSQDDGIGSNRIDLRSVTNGRQFTVRVIVKQRFLIALVETFLLAEFLVHQVRFHGTRNDTSRVAAGARRTPCETI